MKLPAVIGHRGGACGYAPENTLASFRKAAEIGVRCVEFDTKLSRDGEAIVFHDDLLDRVTDGSGAIADFDLNHLRTLEAGRWFDPQFAGEPIPTLAEAVDFLEANGMAANVEIKPSPGRDEESGRVIGALLDKIWPDALPVPLISSFSARALLAVAEAVPRLPRAFLCFEIPDNWQQILQTLGCGALHCRHRELTPKRAAQVLGAGYALRCFTVNKPARARKLFDWGVQSVISDVPDQLWGAVSDA